ncbi:MAG: PIN domain-containing protein [bacterium]|nr:PIN domain-containing protein [bacterium]
MKFLIDTNICIRAIAGKEPDAAFLTKAINENALVLSVVVIAEFLGKALPKEEIAFNKLAQAFPILPIDEETARIAATYRKASLQTSKTKLLDCFLAAQAKQHNLTLVTNNRADFRMKNIKVQTP